MSRSDEFEDIRNIADAICDGQVTPEQMQELEVLLKSSSEAKRFYIDYVGMHSQIEASDNPRMEVVMRRQVDELIFRKAEQGDNGPLAIETSQTQPPEIKHRNHPFLLAACLILLIAVIYLVSKQNKPSDYLAHLVEGNVKAETSESLSSKYLNTGIFTAVDKIKLKLSTADVIEMTDGTKFKLFKNDRIELYSGSLEIIEAGGSDLNIKCPEFLINSHGSVLKIDRTGDAPVVTSGERTTLTPLRWRPNHYWPFESKSDRAIDQAGEAHGIVMPGVSKTKGLVGQGAYFFDNSITALINVGSGGGTAPATGTFAVTEGVTIEALIVPEWAGTGEDLDEIFRKDQTDKDLRMLLSFQNDKGKKYLYPPGDVDESLSFGLYLVGQGYHELKLPLDGKEGRPKLADLKDGKPHHVVATYDVRTGVKAIYIDGVRHIKCNYPPGSKMLSGGPGIANIGNSPNNIKEAFHGVIDEVAFYDFSLPPFMVDRHYKSLGSGKNYYGLEPSAKSLPLDISLQLPKNIKIKIDPLTGLPAEKK